VGFRVAVEQPGLQVFAQALNVSEGGIFLASSEPPELGSSVSVVLSLPPGGRFLRLRGAVVRHGGEAEPAGFAIRFDRIDEPSAAVLGRFIAQMGATV
jgi:hypothetical protein